MQKLPSFFKRKNRSSEERDRDDRESAMNISGPTNVTHDCHVGFDPERGTFTGLPMSWAQWLKDANIRSDLFLCLCHHHQVVPDTLLSCCLPIAHLSVCGVISVIFLV